MPEWVATALAAHIDDWKPLPGERTASPTSAGLLFLGRERKPLTVLVNRYIRPLEALANTSSKDLGL